MVSLSEQTWAIFGSRSSFSASSAGLRAVPLNPGFFSRTGLPLSSLTTAFVSRMGREEDPGGPQYASASARQRVSFAKGRHSVALAGSTGFGSAGGA